MKLSLQRLTPFRFVAALLVVFFHFGRSVVPFDTSWLNQVAAHGNLAVSFFYCLSGFIMASVYRGPMDTSTRKAYWIARFARIYPVYVACLLLSLPLISSATSSQLALSALLLQAWIPGYPLAVNAPGWSLSVEVFFYALFPYMTVLIVRSSTARLIAATASLWIATQYVTFYLFTHHYQGYPSHSHDLIFYFPLMHLNEFVLGACAGVIVVRHGLTLRRVGIAALACMALTQIVVSIADVAGLISLGENGLYAPLFLCAMCAVLALPSARLLESPVAILLGESSYSLYLLQMLVFVPGERLITNLTHNQTFYLCLAILVAISIAAHVLIERPMRTLIRKIAIAKAPYQRAASR
ncbi:Peptidoglycan/LPS O-acetylase OafA/YrhL, contains acyltransferase and SGNH-hydrolase domains [Paraburkholderia fungorum]|uniref:Peptidoglycan/LPS O-acetylase OafA/YrhL, contains acyltransferase and SGNH-hydrolase domains n=1 Tax=Paraburkholderia fungorum TaxID=134537 RepID=A0A1H0YMV0_9BURK|nr:acyltransferase [Paraburkholderia fungorum]SDQ16512.1 Peptidoglycan/LPS O-acetylase OafA/YrhL, contains acyltransferase and SGNH-hydrolase domains [Paraburkholderia fungorum]